MVTGLEALYIQTRRNQTEPSGSPRFNPALLVAALMYPPIAATLVLLGAVGSIASIGAANAKGPVYIVAFAISAALSIILFDARRERLLRKFRCLPEISTTNGKTLLLFAIIAIFGLESALSYKAPWVCLFLFGLLLALSHWYFLRFVSKS